MSANLTAKFETRREAEMAVERLVQEYGIERTDVFVAADGDENTTGLQEARSDDSSAEPATGPRDDAPLHGVISLSVDIADDRLADRVRAAFVEFNAGEVVQE